MQKSGKYDKKRFEQWLKKRALHYSKLTLNLEVYMRLSFADQTEFTKAVVRYQEKPSIARGRKLGKYFGAIISEIISYLKDKPPAVEMARNCFYKCFERINSFDPEKGSAFSYFTTVIINEFRVQHRRLREEEKRRKHYERFVPDDFLD